MATQGKNEVRDEISGYYGGNDKNITFHNQSINNKRNYNDLGNQTY